MKQTTLTDIALQAGVSVKSVHGVLNDKAGIRVSEKKRRKILDLAKTLDYTPNHFASSLKTGKTNIIGVTSGANVPIRRVFNDPLFANLFTGIGDAAADNGYRVLFQQNNEDEPDTSLAMVTGRMVDGIIFILLSQHTDDFLENQLPRLKKTGVPFCVVITFGTLDTVRTVGMNARQGAYESTLHLLEHGYREIGFLYFDSGDNGYSRAMRDGFETALKEKGIEPSAVTRLGTDAVYPGSAYKCMDAFLKSGNALPRALFCTEVRLANGALVRLKEEGIAVPGECAVAAYGIEQNEAQLLSELTVSRAPVEETGRAAMENLVEQMSGKSAGSIILEPKLNIRRTCGCIKTE